MARKSKYKPKPFESCGEHFKDCNGTIRADTSANIYESMMISKAFRSLNNRQRVLYMVCKAQYYGHRKPKQDFPDIEKIDAECFYLNWANVQQYGLYSERDHAGFYRDMKVLCKYGFIQQISSGQAKRTKSIYRFSADWREI